MSITVEGCTFKLPKLPQSSSNSRIPSNISIYKSLSINITRLRKKRRAAHVNPESRARELE